MVTEEANAVSVPALRRCSKCGDDKPATGFLKGHARCADCRAAYLAAYYLANREKYHARAIRPDTKEKNRLYGRRIAAIARSERDALIDPGTVVWRWKGVWRTPAHLWQHWIEPRISPEPNTGCWLWEGPTGRAYRAQFKIDKRNYFVGRIACVVFHGAPDINDRSWFACHHCDTPNCINPGHLYVGDKSTNTLDDVRRGTRPTGPQITRCKNGHDLTPDTTSMAPPTADRPHGRRVCKACHVANQRRYLERKAG